MNDVIVDGQRTIDSIVAWLRQYGWYNSSRLLHPVVDRRHIASKYPDLDERIGEGVTDLGIQLYVWSQRGDPGTPFRTGARSGVHLKVFMDHNAFARQLVEAGWHEDYPIDALSAAVAVMVLRENPEYFTEDSESERFTGVEFDDPFEFVDRWLNHQLGREAPRISGQMREVVESVDLTS